jgi:hypothetical protein
MYASPESRFQPAGKIFDEFPGKVAPMPRPLLLEIVFKMFLRDVREVDGISTEVEEMPGNQCEATLLGNVMFCVNPSLVGSTIVSEWHLVVHPHGVNQLAMPSTDFQVGSTCSCDPIAYFR